MLEDFNYKLKNKNGIELLYEISNSNHKFEYLIFSDNTLDKIELIDYILKCGNLGNSSYSYFIEPLKDLLSEEELLNMYNSCEDLNLNLKKMLGNDYLNELLILKEVC